MKIALYNLTTTTKAGGIETFNLEMGRALAERGHVVHIYGGKGDMARNVSPSVAVRTYPYVHRESIPDLGSRFRKFAERLTFGAFALKDLIREEYDCIYISKPFDMPVALLASRYSGARVIFGSGGTEFFTGYRFLVKRLDYFLACSSFNASQIERYCGIRPAVLYNGVNTEIFRPLSPDLSLRDRLKIASGEIVAVSACRLVGWKGIQYALRAVSELASRNYRLRYFIIGDGPYRKSLEALAVQLNLDGRVTFLGRIDNGELPRYYSLCSFAIYPSVADETFGISIAEAMACGLPVVATRVGGIPEVVREGSGLLVSPRDGHALAMAIEELLLDGEEMRNLGLSARAHVCEAFAWDKIADSFERMLSVKDELQG